MLVDQHRNDIGRVAEISAVEMRSSTALNVTRMFYIFF